MHTDPKQQQSPVAPGRAELTHDMVRHLLDQGYLEQQKRVRRLRSLPQECAQPYGWDEFRRRAQQRAAVATRRAVNVQTYLAVAAVLVMVAVGLATWMRLTRSDVTQSVVDRAPSETNRRILERSVGSDSSDTVDRRAEAAELWLAGLPSEPGVVRVGTRSAVTGLEDRIAQLDDFLSTARVEGLQPATLADIEKQRALLIKSLVQVRYAETLVSELR